MNHYAAIQSLLELYIESMIHLRLTQGLPADYKGTIKDLLRVYLVFQSTSLVTLNEPLCSYSKSIRTLHRVDGSPQIDSRSTKVLPIVYQEST